MTKRLNRNTRLPGGRASGAPTGRLVLAGLCLACLGGLFYAIFSGLSALQDVYHQQCVVIDSDTDVVVTSGKMIHPDVVIGKFGLTNGANLATIDFKAGRTELLARIPNIRDVRIERRLPNRVTIDVIEREPVARVAAHAGSTATDRVVDTEGVVFNFSRNVSTLPIIREAQGQARVKPGERLAGNALAALQLLEAASEPEHAELGVQEVALGGPDFLLATLGNYQRARIAWDHMGENSRLAGDSLRRQLRHLAQAIAQNLSPSQRTVWDATDYGHPGYVYANDPQR